MVGSGTIHRYLFGGKKIKNLQVAFLRSGIPDQDLVQDAASFRPLQICSGASSKTCHYRIKFSTECCREPEEWGGYLGIDELLINDILKKFGDPSLKPFPITDIITYKFIYQIILRMKVHHPLNLVNYSKKRG